MLGRDNIMGLFSWKQDARTDHSWHSASFHQYFEGYTETKVTDPATGRTRIQRIYTDPYYYKDISDSKWKIEKLLYIAAFAASLVLFEICTAFGASNAKLYTQIPQILTTLCFLYCLYVNINYLFSPRRMTTGQYNSASVRLISAYKLIMLPIAASVLAELVYIVLPDHPDKTLALVSMAGFFISGLLCFLICRHEDSVTYKQLLNENAGVPGNRISA